MILVLGASGYIGGNIFRSFGSSRAVGTHNGNSTPGTIFFDATRMSIGDVIGPGDSFSHAFICFAEANLDACKADIERSNAINVRGTINVIDDLAKRGITPVFLSSDCVFDGQKGNYSESDPPNPSTVYGSQKFQIERFMAESLDEYAVMRLAKVFGTNPHDGTIMAGWLDQIQRHEQIRAAYDQVFFAHPYPGRGSYCRSRRRNGPNRAVQRL